MTRRAERCKCLAHRRCKHTTVLASPRPVWWGAKPPYAPAARAASPQREAGLGRGAAPSPPAHLALGAGPLRVPGTSLSLENRRGACQALAGARVPDPVSLELCSVVGQGDGVSTACGCPPAPRQCRGAVVNHPLARPPDGLSTPPAGGVWARVVVHGGRDCYKRHF